LLTDESVVEHVETGRLGGKLERNAVRLIVGDIAIKVDGTTEDRLSTVASVSGIDAAIIENSNVVHTAIGFDEVVVREVDIVSVDINGRSPSFGITFWRAIG